MPRKKKLISALVAVAVVIAAVAVASYFLRKGAETVTGIITEEKKDILERDTLRHRETFAGNIDDSAAGLLQYTDASNAVDAAYYNDRLYVATGGGLLAYTGSLSPAAFYTNLNGLASSDVTALASFGDSLFIGFGGRGLMRLQRGDLFGIEFFEPSTGELFTDMVVTDLHVAGGKLYIASFDRGLIAFDGNRYKKVFLNKSAVSAEKITSLGDAGGSIAAGTHDNGIFIKRDAAFRRLTKQDGLPDNHIVKLSSAGDTLYACTPLGYALLNPGRGVIDTEMSGEFVTDVASHGGRQYVGTFDNGIVIASRSITESLFKDIRINGFFGGGYLLALTESGPYALEDEGWKELESPQRAARSLPGNYITAIEPDAAGNIWIGTFENGLAAGGAGGDIISRYSDEKCLEVNTIARDPGGNSMYVGANNGLLKFDALPSAGGYSVIAGLIDDAVTHILFTDIGIVVSTPKGVTIIGEKQKTSYYAFHGLVNNHAYSSASAGDNLYFGTLGGISIFDGAAFAGRITASEGGLSHNWTTALLAARGSIYAGTYGGGVDVIDPAGGAAAPIGGARRNFEVNFNALAFYDNNILAGTLRHGLQIYDLNTKRWRDTSIPLGCDNVTAVRVISGRFFIGTECGLTVADSLPISD